MMTEIFIKTTMPQRFILLPAAASNSKKLPHFTICSDNLCEILCTCGACVCDVNVALSVVRQRKVSQNKSGLTPAILDFTGQEISARPHHTLQAQRTSANTSKLARRPYAPHPQVRTKLAIQKNKHNQNKQAV